LIAVLLAAGVGSGGHGPGLERLRAKSIRTLIVDPSAFAYLALTSL